jgi:hypothetical protein
MSDNIIYTDLGNKILYNPTERTLRDAITSSYLLCECTKQWLAKQIGISPEEVDSLEEVRAHNAHFGYGEEEDGYHSIQ